MKLVRITSSLLACAFWAMPALADSSGVDKETQTAQDPRPSADVWGDPEEGTAGPRSWTWFGMGYERRTRRLSTQEPAVPAEADSPGTQGRTGSGR